MEHDNTQLNWSEHYLMDKNGNEHYHMKITKLSFCSYRAVEMMWNFPVCNMNDPVSHVFHGHGGVVSLSS